MVTDCVIYLIVPRLLADHVGEAYPNYEGSELSLMWGVSEGLRWCADVVVEIGRVGGAIDL